MARVAQLSLCVNGMGGAAGSYDGVIIIWNIDSGAIKSRLLPPNWESVKPWERAVEKVAFMNTRKNQNNLLSAGADGCATCTNQRAREPHRRQRVGVAQMCGGMT